MLTLSCKVCGCPSLVTVTAKCDDRCVIQYNDKELCDYVPSGIGIGGGDYIEFTYCHVCFHILGQLPVTLQSMAAAMKEVEHQ